MGLLQTPYFGSVRHCRDALSPACMGIRKRYRSIFNKVDRQVIKIMRKAYEEKKGPFGGKTRHRAFLWGPSAVYYTDFPTWIQNCWGINIVLNMDSTMGHNMINTEDPDEAIKDLALFSRRRPCVTTPSAAGTMSTSIWGVGKELQLRHGPHERQHRLQGHARRSRSHGRAGKGPRLPLHLHRGMTLKTAVPFPVRICVTA